MKKLVSLLIALSLILGCMTAVADSADGKTQLTVWAWNLDWNGAAIMEAAAIAGNVDINFVDITKADLLTKLHTVLASGNTDELPDIVLISDLAAPSYFMSYPGAFYNLSGIVDYSKFAGYKQESVSYEGVPYGVPFDTGVAAMFYRADYMAEAGYSEEDMQSLTWDEFIALGDALMANGHYLTTLNPSDVSIFQIMLQSAGAWYTNEEGLPDFVNNAALKECFENFKDMKDSGNVKLISGWTEYAGAIANGDIAATVSGGWLVGTVKQTVDQEGLWRIAPVPRMTDVENGTEYSSQGGSSWYVLSTSDKAQFAAQFLSNTFGNSTDLYNTIMEEKSIQGTYLPAANIPAYDTEEAFFGGQKVFKLLADWTGLVPQVFYGAYSAEAQTLLATAIGEYLNGGDIDETLTTAQEQLLLMME